MNPAPLHIRLLGQYTITLQDRLLPPLPTEKSRALFAYLILYPAPHARSHLAGLFWPDLPEKTARRRLTQELWRIGSELEKTGVDGALAATGAAVSISSRLAFTCDVTLLQAGLARLRNGDPTARPAVEELAALYQGDLLPGYYDDWVLVARERLFNSFKDGLAQLLAGQKRLGDWHGAVQTANALLAHDPLAEEWVAEAMQIALALNRPEAGMRHYERYVDRLRVELESAPGPELTLLAQQLAARKTAGVAGQAAAFTAPNYEPPLIGREGERALLLQALAQVEAGRGQLSLLEGAAGVGKSRLLETIMADARWRGRPAAWGAAPEIHLNQPYHPLIQALSTLLSPLRAQQLQVLLDPLWLAVAARVLPSLAEWLPDLPSPPPLDPEPERVRVLEALTRLILALGRLVEVAV